MDSDIPQDKFGNIINKGDIIIFATTGEMKEGEVHSLNRRGLKVRNSNGYLKDKKYTHVINKSALLRMLPELAL